MVLLYLMDLTFALLLAWFVGTQIIMPCFHETPLLPWFRSKTVKEINHALEGQREDVQVAEKVLELTVLEGQAAQLRKQADDLHALTNKDKI